LVSGLGNAGELSTPAAAELGLSTGISITYRAGDQPNNAFALNVLECGEVAATAGTSGVIYAVTDRLIADSRQRINSFLHGDPDPAAAQDKQQNIGLLACINGAGRANSWLRSLLTTYTPDLSYDQLNATARQAPLGCDNLNFYPFGNGAERIFNNAIIGAHIQNLDFNRHTLAHITRAAHEGIAFAMASGLELIQTVGVECKIIHAGASNMFQSELFTEALVNTTGIGAQIYNTDGAEGAARGAAWGLGFYKNRAETFANLQVLKTIEPDAFLADAYTEKFAAWQSGLSQYLHMN
jgi:xylulokinase